MSLTDNPECSFGIVRDVGQSLIYKITPENCAGKRAREGKMGSLAHPPSSPPILGLLEGIVLRLVCTHLLNQGKV